MSEQYILIYLYGAVADLCECGVKESHQRTADN